MQEKTNVIRILDKSKIKYVTHNYNSDKAYSGCEVAKMIGESVEKVFKTLVLTSKSKKNYVFVVPVNKELDLKKAAKIVGEKNVELICQKDLLPLTGYVHGGCSPIGMKKYFPTVIDSSALTLDTIIFSGGKIGLQVEMSYGDLQQIIRITDGDIVE